MPFAITDDGVRLYFEETGSGIPIVFVHEFAGDFRSWEPQIRQFSRQYRCITFNARGYPPSDVPPFHTSYSQERAALDVRCVLDHLGIERAHIVGFSMGGFAALQFGISCHNRALSLCIAGCGYGAALDQREKFRSEADALIAFIEKESMETFSEKYSAGPTRVQYQDKDPRGFSEFKRLLSQLSPLGLVNTQKGIQRERPSLYHLTDEMAGITVPTLVVTGDEDWSCLEPSILMKKHIRSAALAVIPNSAHNINLETTREFNALLADFLGLADAGRWPRRNPRAMSNSIIGM